MKGNRKSQRRLYERYYGFGLKVCLRYSSNRQDATVILNDGFLRVFNKLEQFDTSQTFEPWLRRILVHQAIDHFRSRKNKPGLIELKQLTASKLTHLPPQDGPGDHSILFLVQQLPPMYRTVFNLYVMEEYKHDEIAEKLNISASTSRSNLSRAKEILRDLHQKSKSRGIKFN